jgi:assimilatory nitrate reductase catalytic subunit
MGGRDVGAFPNQLAAHLRFDNAEDRALLKDFWLAPRLAEKPGLNAEQLFGAVLAGKVKALWIAGTDPVENLPHGDRVRAALEICPLVVATDCWIKETIMRADIVLPAAAWGEKTGTVTNAERVISPRKRCRNAPGDAMPEWWMFTELAKRMGFADAFHYHAPADIFREHAALSGFGNGGRRVFDIGSLANISDTTYETLQPVRWPQPVGRPSPARLFGKGGFPEDGRARIVPLVVKLPGKTNTAHPFRLASTQVGAEPILRISPSDATMLGLSRDDLVRVATRHANTLLPVEIAAEQGLGEVAAAMGAQHPAEAVGRLLGMKRGAAAGAKQEFAAVARVPAYWHGVMLSRESLVPAGRFFWSRCTAGEGLHQFRLIGWKQMVNNKPLDWAARLCGMKDNDERIELSDPAQGVYRLAIVSKGALVTILFIAPTSGQLPSPVTLQALFARGDAFPRRFEILHGALNKSRHDQNVGGVYSENYQREGKIS